MSLRFLEVNTGWDLSDFWSKSNAIVWADSLGLWVVAGGTIDGSGGVLIATSPDGLTWTKRTVPSDPRDPPSRMNDIAWSPDVPILVAIGDDADFSSVSGAFGTQNDHWTSPDAVTWTARGRIFTDAWPESIVWSPTLSLFVATSTRYQGATSHTKMIKTSPDGVTWTSRTTGIDSTISDFVDVCWSEDLGLFVAIANRYSFPSGTYTGSYIFTSPDGTTWTQRATYTEQLVAVEWFPFAGKFLVTVYYAGSAGDLVSADGISWSSVADNTGTVLHGLWDFAGMIAIKQSHGGGGGFETSTDLETWTDAPDGLDADLRGAWSPDLDMGVGVGANVAVSGPDPITGEVTEGTNVANGTVASNTLAEDVEWYFQWGLSEGTVDDNSMPTQTQGPGFTDEPVSQELGPDLPVGTIYYRLVATHRGVTFYGETLSYESVMLLGGGGFDFIIVGNPS